MAAATAHAGCDPPSCFCAPFRSFIVARFFVAVAAIPRGRPRVVAVAQLLGLTRANSHKSQIHEFSRGKRAEDSHVTRSRLCGLAERVRDVEKEDRCSSLHRAGAAVAAAPPRNPSSTRKAAWTAERDQRSCELRECLVLSRSKSLKKKLPGLRSVYSSVES